MRLGGQTISVSGLDCCDREAMSFVATTSGITGEDVRDLMVAAVEQRFGPVNRLPVEIEWLTDNGSCYAFIWLLSRQPLLPDFLMSTQTPSPSARVQVR